MTVSEGIVQWGWGLRLDDVPPQVLDAAALHLLDGIGTALAARRIGAAEYAMAVAGSGGGPAEAAVLGSDEAVGAPWAAFANGVLTHALDYDDTHTGALVHATAVTLPAALAVAEQGHRSGRDLLLATVVGYEVVARLGMVAPHGFHARGFHATAVCGTFAATIVASRLYRSTKAEAVAALGIAGSQAAGSLEFLSTGASTKQVHPGWASLAGVVAARLARAGASGPATVLEGERGLYALFTDQRVEADDALTGLGEQWETERITIKPYPACHLLHKTLDAAQPMVGTEVDDIAELVVSIPSESVPIVCEPVQHKKSPRSGYEAKFSVQWCLAALLTDGRVDSSTFGLEALRRPEVASLAQRVRHRVQDHDGPAADAPGEVLVVMRDGSTRTERVGAGPVSTSSMRDAVLAKFHSNAGGATEERTRLADAVLDLPSCDDVTAVTRAAADVARSWSAGRGA